MYKLTLVFFVQMKQVKIDNITPLISSTDIFLVVLYHCGMLSAGIQI